MSEDPIREFRIKVSPTQILLIRISVAATAVVPKPPRPLHEGFVLFFGVNDQFVKVEIELQQLTERLADSALERDQALAVDGDMSKDPFREFSVKLSHTQILSILVGVAATAVVPMPPRPRRDELMTFFRTDEDQIATIDFEIQQLDETVVVPNPPGPGG